MGNRATVIFTDGKKSFSPAVYLHWNGGPESVYGFLEELNRRKARADQEYECARFIELVGDFFDQDEFGSTSLGVTNGPKSDKPEDLAKVNTDHSDNGFYLVNRTNNHMQVRRFIERHKGDWSKPDSVSFYLDEMSPEQVEQERLLAYKDNYGLLKDVFQKIAGERPVSKYG